MLTETTDELIIRICGERGHRTNIYLGGPGWIWGWHCFCGEGVGRVQDTFALLTMIRDKDLPVRRVHKPISL